MVWQFFASSYLNLYVTKGTKKVILVLRILYNIELKKIFKIV